MTKDKSLDMPFSMSESFEDLLNSDVLSSNKLVGTVVKGEILNIEKGFAIIDVGLKSEGRVSLDEFGHQSSEMKSGDQVDVYVERMENKDGMIVLSREKARREAAWIDLEKSFQSGERVNGSIFGKVRGGFTVDLSGAVAFLPGSQVDVRPIRDINPLMNIDQPFQILKMDRARGNIVVSRRAVLEESRAEARSELISNLSEGQVLEGSVKNITDYGAFIDLGGVDGLLHVTDISWKRVSHPSEALEVGQKLKVQVIRFNPDTQRISLGLKQLEEDPWKDVASKYSEKSNFDGHVTNITDYGAFIELEEGVEGLAHVSDISWTRKGVHPSQLVSVGQKVEVKVLGVDLEKRRIALGVKQCIINPWEQLKDQFEIGSESEGEIKNITEFGLFVGLTDEIDGMVHMSDLSWTESGDDAIKHFKKGEKIKVKIINIDPEKERVVLGVKQLENDPFESGTSNLKKGDNITCTITDVQDAGIEVSISDNMKSFIRRADLAKERNDRETGRFKVGDKIEAKVSSIDKKSRRVSLSIRSLEIESEKNAVNEYGSSSSNSGASLGDILGSALKKQSLTQIQNNIKK